MSQGRFSCSTNDSVLVLLASETEFSALTWNPVACEEATLLWLDHSLVPEGTNQTTGTNWDKELPCTI